MSAGSFTDYYAVLGVAADALESDIRRAYTDQIKAVHPDKLQHVSADTRLRAEQRTRELNEAKEILLDAEKRANYDLEYRYRLSEAAANASQYGYGQRYDGANYNDYMGRSGEILSERESKLRSQAGGSRIFIFVAITVMSLLAIVWRFVSPEGAIRAVRPAESISLSKAVAARKLPAPAEAMTLSPDGRTLIVAAGASLVIYNGDLTDSATVVDAGSPVLAVAATNTLIAAACKDGLVRLYALEIINAVRTVKLLRLFRGHQAAVCAVAFSPDGLLLVSSSWDKTAKVWQTGDGSVQRTLLGIAFPIYAVQFTSDAKHIALTDNQLLKLWTWREGTLKQLAIAKGTLKSLAVSGSTGSDWIAASGADGVIRQLNLKGGSQRLADGEGSAINKVSFSTDGRWMAVAGDDGRVRVYGAESSRRIETIAAHSGSAAG
ncbi:MAG: DnaJ domain-containing protein, partial [Rhizobacter sp.]|nr:DnaJ domain-containing protein [Chlorobiales bacterium]